MLWSKCECHSFVYFGVFINLLSHWCNSGFDLKCFKALIGKWLALFWILSMLFHTISNPFSFSVHELISLRLLIKLNFSSFLFYFMLFSVSLILFILIIIWVRVRVLWWRRLCNVLWVMNFYLNAVIITTFLSRYFFWFLNNFWLVLTCFDTFLKLIINLLSQMMIFSNVNILVKRSLLKIEHFEINLLILDSGMKYNRKNSFWKLKNFNIIKDFFNSQITDKWAKTF